MSLAFLPLELPAEEDLLVNWLIRETWPFHVDPHLCQTEVKRWIQSGLFTGIGHQTFWILSASEARVGLIRLFDLGDVDDRYPRFDLRIRSVDRNQGIGKQAVQWLTCYLFETWPQLERIVGTTRHDNHAMRHVFRHCGYIKEGHFRRDWQGDDGKKYDTIQYAILREDWGQQAIAPAVWNDESDQNWVIRPYQQADEAQWLRCRVLAFLDTAYFDNVEREKEQYANASIELVAELDGQLVGLIDIECEEQPGSVCSPPVVPEMVGKAGMIWHLAVHPDFRRQGIGKSLLAAAIALAEQSQLCRLEAWTRDDAAALGWYEAQGFQKVETYLHVYLERDEMHGGIQSTLSGLRPMHVFAHYQGDSTDHIRQQFRRVHDCNRYDLAIRSAVVD